MTCGARAQVRHRDMRALTTGSAITSLCATGHDAMSGLARLMICQRRHGHAASPARLLCYAPCAYCACLASDACHA